MKVIPVDCNYVETEFACSYLLVHVVGQQKRGFFIECNTNYAIPYLVKAAKAQGLAPDQIDGLIITHVHLDHAGGTGLFLKEFPNAKVYAHPRAARHIIDPSKLIASATQVYGEAFMQKLYGTIIPAPADRVVVLDDGASVDWKGTKLKTKHTRGHANHHLCVYIDADGVEPATVFTGDSFGVSYPKVNQKRGLVMIVTTSPTDFDGNAALETIDWVESLKSRAALTHYGFVDSKDIPRAAKMLKDQIRFSIDLVARIKRSVTDVKPMTEAQTLEHIKDWTIQYFANQNIHFDPEDLKILNLDFRVNAQGLMYAATHIKN